MLTRNGWKKTAPSENISPEETIFVAVECLNKTGNMLKASIETFPATISFDDDKITWHLFDENGHYNLTSDKNKSLDTTVRPAEAKEKLLIAWCETNAAKSYVNKNAYVIVGYNRNNKSFITLCEDDDLDGLKRVLNEFCIYAEANKSFPFRDEYGANVDWLEIYHASEMGQIDKRICYTNAEYKIKYYDNE